MQLRPYQAEVHNDCMEYLKAANYQGPAIINASVGAGKSVLIAAIAKHCQDAPRLKDRPVRAISIQRSGELCSQNSEAAFAYGVNRQSISSASLNRKSNMYPIIFATEGTLYRALKTEFVNHPVDILMIDECHMCPFDEPDTQFMQIIGHFLRLNPNTRILGYTGSPYRGTDTIIGPFWTNMIGNISTDWLIEQGWLVPPSFGWPDSQDTEFDFKDLKPKYGSFEFDEKQLNDIVMGDPSRTRRIMAEVLHKTQDRNGVLIFCSSVKHTEEVAKSLPLGSYCIITGATGGAERMDLLAKVKSGEIKYCINVSVLTTGVNLPILDTIVFLRPIGSLVLLTQSIGRGLRLHEDKTDCLVLDHGGVMERIGHLYNSPMLDEAEYERAKKEEKELITCPNCSTENSPHARRCRGEDSSSADNRCEFFWSFKECPHCQTQNDPTAQQCRKCSGELRDPNEKLLNTPYADQDYEPVTGWNIAPLKNGSIKVEYLLEAERKDGNPAAYLNPGSTSHGAKQAFKQWLSVNKENGGQGYGLHILSKQSPESAAKFVVKYWINPMKPPTGIKFRVNGKGKYVIGRVTRE